MSKVVPKLTTPKQTKNTTKTIKTTPAPKPLPPKISRPPASVRPLRSRPLKSAQSVENSVPSETVARGRVTTDTFLSAHNPYLASLRDPVHAPGARIPDGNTVSTSTIQMVYHTTSTSGAGLKAGCLMGYNGTSTNGPYMVPQNGITCNVGGYAITGALAMTTNPTSASDAAPFSESTGATGSLPVQATGLSPFFAANCQYARVVSACMSIRSTSNFTSNQGFFVAGSLPHDFFQSTGNSPTNTSLDVYRNAPGAISRPINDLNNGGLQTVYTPFDDRCTQFVDLDNTGNIALTDERLWRLNPGILYVIATGVPTGQVFLIDIVVNYEIVVVSGVISYGVRPTLDDPLAMATAKNARSTDSLVGPSTDFDENGDYATSIGQTLTSTAKGPPLGLCAVALEKGPNSTTTAHFLGGPVRLKRRSNPRRVASAEQVDEKPLTESIIDGLISVATKVGPKLLQMLL